MFKILLLSLLISFSAPALAIYKCESNGKITYSDEPCRGGKVLDVDPASGKTAASDAADAADAADAGKQITREKSEVKRLENERHKREAKDEQAQQKAARISAAKHKKCVSLAMRKKWGEEDAAAASGKSAEKAKRNARRKAEKYETECGK
ncbi:MAG: hypothetical protein JWQ21_3198 [Herminiimonas sp.]|nr:hypothetical protein [Herminiimonas sp.]